MLKKRFLISKLQHLPTTPHCRLYNEPVLLFSNVYDLFLWVILFTEIVTDRELAECMWEKWKCWGEHFRDESQVHCVPATHQPGSVLHSWHWRRGERVRQTRLCLRACLIESIPADHCSSYVPSAGRTSESKSFLPSCLLRKPFSYYFPVLTPIFSLPIIIIVFVFPVYQHSGWV